MGIASTSHDTSCHFAKHPTDVVIFQGHASE